MTEPGAVLEAAHTAIADLAAVLVAVRTGLGGGCVRARSHLEMGEIDLLSARDAVEKARLEIDLAVPTVADVRVAVPLSVGSIVAAERGNPRALPSPPARRCDPDHRAGVGAGTRQPGSPGHGQGELFSVHDVTSRALQLTCADPASDLVLRPGCA